MSIRLALEIGNVTIFHLVLWEQQAEEEAAEVAIPVVTDVGATEHYTHTGFHATLEPHWDDEE